MALENDEAGRNFITKFGPLSVFINAVSKIHDFGNSWNYDQDTGQDIQRNPWIGAVIEIYSGSTMLPAAAIAGAAEVILKSVEMYEGGSAVAQSTDIPQKG